MNKKQIIKIKRAMCYEDHPEQKRVLRELKRQYAKLPSNERAQFIIEVEEFFNKAKNK